MPEQNNANSNLNKNFTELKSTIKQFNNCQMSNDRNQIDAEVVGKDGRKYQVKITLPDNNVEAFAMVQKITTLSGQTVSEINLVNQAILECCCIHDDQGQLIFGSDNQGQSECKLELLTIDVFSQIKSLFFLFLV